MELLTLFPQTVCYRLEVMQDVEKALKGILVISTIPMKPSSAATPDDKRVPDEKLEETAVSAVLKFPSRVATPDDIKFLAERLKDERYAMQKLAVDFIGRTELRLCVLSNRWR